MHQASLTRCNVLMHCERLRQQHSTRLFDHRDRLTNILLPLHTHPHESYKRGNLSWDQASSLDRANHALANEVQAHDERGPDANVVGAVGVDVEAGVDLDNGEQGIEGAELACGEAGALLPWSASAIRYRTSLWINRGRRHAFEYLKYMICLASEGVKHWRAL